MKKNVPSEFERAAQEPETRGFFSDFREFLRQNRKWWLLPIIAVLLIFGVLVLLSGTGFAPFIYTLF